MTPLAPEHPATVPAHPLAKLGLERPVEVVVPAAARPLALARVAAVVPCFNRRQDAEALLADLAAIDTAGIDLRVLLVDNASAQPLSTLPTPPGVHLTHLRLPTNTGGSGGYNAGMVRVLGLDADSSVGGWSGFDAEYLWLVDSDARVGPATLHALLAVLRADREIVAAGAAIHDPQTGQCFELGGHVNRRNGNFEPMVTGAAGVLAASPDALVDCDYVAACCALVRADAVRAAGLFPDTFLNGDDVEWCIRLKQATAGRVVGVPWAMAMHPRFDRFPTWTRYYMARNALGPLRALNIPRRVRVRRAMLEVPRAVQQAMMGRSDLARLHTAALRHAARSLGNRAVAPAGVINVEPTRPLNTLTATLRERLGEGRARRAAVHPRLMVDDRDRAIVLDQLKAAGFTPAPPRGHGPAGIGLIKSCLGAARRWVLGPEAPVAVVPARGKPETWFLGRTNIQLVPGGYVLRPAGRLANPLRALSTLAAGTLHAARAGLRAGEGPIDLKPEYIADAMQAEHAAGRDTPGELLSVEAIVLSYNRWPALEATLTALLKSPEFQPRPGRAPRTITVVDNASTDGTPARVEEFFPQVRLMRLDSNLGVEAFDRAVHESSADAVLILDDDSIPDDASLSVAIHRLARLPSLGAVTLHPIHPRTKRSEWRFAASARSAEGGGVNNWPVMGCGNLVRRAAWNSAGGYERAFFLYRNDTDPALTLLARGWGVHFDPALTIAHDTPAGAGAPKSPRWHELATRNWAWMCKRHAGPLTATLAIAIGWAWAHRLAGLSPARHAATLRGGLRGLFTKAPDPGESRGDGQHLARLLRLQTLGR